MELLPGFCRRFCFLLLFFCCLSSRCFADTRLDPAYEVPDYVVHLLDIARGEIGYTEGPHGYTKYGEWSGDPYAQWCAEFLCWCVDQVDQRYGTALLDQVYPLYSSSNVGKQWYIEHGRYLVRWGNLEGWGYQWLKRESSFITTGSYIPQPGDWVFFTWTNDLNTDHVAMVEYCTRAKDGSVTIHVIEGNTPSSVKRTTYPLTYGRILGFGTVHDAADWTMRSGNAGEKVRQLQTKLVKTGYLSDPSKIDGRFGPSTQSAVMAFQADHGIRANGIANMTTQKALNAAYREKVNEDPETWLVEDGDSEASDDFSIDLESLFSFGPEKTEETEILLEDLAGPADEDELDEDETDQILDQSPDWLDASAD